jgi:YfiH family protein
LPKDARPQADALVTRTPGVALGVLAADCVPVLFCDPQARVIGAAHAGWKGAIGGVIEATVAAMAKLGAAPSSIKAGIGPCIAQRSYEVGPEFPAPFLAEDETHARFFAPSRKDGHFMFDLRGFVGERLRRAGCGEIHSLPNDTCAESARFFSYRRACLSGEKDYGRGLSAIALAE